LNILQIISSGGFFGAENVVLHLASELQKFRHSNCTVCIFENLASPNLELFDFCQRSGIPSISLKCRGKFDPLTIFQLRRLIKNDGIDIIHSHGYKANLYSYFSSLNLPVFLVSTCHNWIGEDIKMKFYEVLDRIFLKKFSWVVGVSEEIKHKIINSGVNNSKVSIIKSGIPIDRFTKIKSKDEIKNSLCLPEHSFVIGTVGRMSSEKSHRTLLNISKDIIKRAPQTFFLLIGDGPLRGTLQKEFNAPSIIFTGIRKDVPDLYQCMDIFVLPSLMEGLPMALLEAMASNLPVVATRVGEIPKVIDHGVTGLLISPGDENGLKEAINYLLENPEIGKEMGRKGYLRVKEHFFSVRMARDYMKIYQKVTQSTDYLPC
jgi:glycosyltransferase involved in cell wall biosynthesis